MIKYASGTLGSAMSTSSTTTVVLGTLKIEFLSWGDQYSSFLLKTSVYKSYATGSTEVLSYFLLNGGGAVCDIDETILDGTTSWVALSDSRFSVAPSGYNYGQFAAFTTNSTPSTTFAGSTALSVGFGG